MAIRSPCGPYSAQTLLCANNQGTHLQEGEEGGVLEEASCQAIGNHSRALLAEGGVVARLPMLLCPVLEDPSCLIPPSLEPSVSLLCESSATFFHFRSLRCNTVSALAEGLCALRGCKWFLTS